jgi:hypothetical protein
LSFLQAEEINRLHTCIADLQSQLQRERHRAELLESELQVLRAAQGSSSNSSLHEINRPAEQQQQQQAVAGVACHPQVDGAVQGSSSLQQPAEQQQQQAVAGAACHAQVDPAVQGSSSLQKPAEQQQQQQQATTGAACHPQDAAVQALLPDASSSLEWQQQQQQQYEQQQHTELMQQVLLPMQQLHLEHQRHVLQQQQQQQNGAISSSSCSSIGLDSAWPSSNCQQQQHLFVPAAAGLSSSSTAGQTAGQTSGQTVDQVVLTRTEHELLLLNVRAMDAVKEGITIADCSKPDMPLMYVNMGFCRITGYSLAEVLYKNCRFLQVRGGAAGGGLCC